MEKDHEEGIPMETIAALVGANEPEYLILEVPKDLLRLTEQLIGESGWRPSSHANYWYRVDQARPEMHLLRHIAVAHKKHINTKTKQVSWNDNGTRHDRSTFADTFKGMQVAKAIARDVLDSPDSIVFEQSSSVTRLGLLLEQAEGNLPADLKPLCFRAVPKSEA
jgi:hypothetical protein